jgi:ABC-type multidrug transport system fused ATPase/permease subunit
LVVGEGNHKELVENSKIYKNFYEKQIKKNWCCFYTGF